MARPKKVHRFKVTAYKNAAGSNSWRVTGTMTDGTRVRQNFKDKADAIRKLGDLELETEGKPESRQSLRTLLTPQELADAEVASAQLAGESLSKTVAHYLNLKNRALQKGLNLDQAMTFFESHYRPETKSITILNAKEEYLQTRNRISEATRANYDTGLSLLLKPDPNKLVHTFTISDIECALLRYKNIRSQRSFRTIFSGFFRWAKRHHYCLENPCARLDKLPKDMSQIATLSLEESKRLLYAAMQLQDGSAAACVAIGLFAGLRPSEIRDLNTEDILKGKIRVSGGKLRRQLKRSVPIPPALDAWLKEFPFEGLPPGWDGKMKRLKKVTNARKWVQDIIRHTSITFQAERDKNEALTAYNNGTSKQMMDRHYRDIVDDEKVIAEFWNLTPERLLAKPPEVDLGIKRRVKWPDKKALEKLVWEKPMIHAAKEIGVSDVALRKRCVALGVDLPPVGHWIKRF